MASKSGVAINRSVLILIAILVIAVGSVSLYLSSSPQSSQDKLNNATGTSSSSNHTQPIEELRGRVTLSGAWALYPMAVVWGEEFQKLHPNVKVEVSAGGAGKGMADALGGLVDIGMVSRDIDPAEVAKGAYPVAVTKDAVIATINANNPVLNDLLSKGITREVFIGIFIDGTIKTWGEAVGRPEIKDEIHVYTRSDAAGAPEIWAKYLGKKQEDLNGIGVYGDPGVLATVQKDPLGIGYNNYNYVFDIKSGLPVPGVKIAPFDIDRDGKVDAKEDISTRAKTVQAIKSGVFPHPPARVEYFVTKDKPTGLEKEFIKWLLIEGQKFVDEVGYIELSKESLDDSLRKVE